MHLGRLFRSGRRSLYAVLVLLAFIPVLSFLWGSGDFYAANSAPAQSLQKSKAANSSGKTAAASSSQAKPGAAAANTSAVASQAKSLTPVLSKPKKGSKLCLWKVSSPEGGTLYLLGTIHIFKPEYYPLPDEMQTAFQKASALILEVNLSKSDKSKMQELIRENGIYGPQDSLSNNVSPETLELLKAYCRKGGVPFQNLMRMKPWMAALTIMQLEMQRLGYSNDAGIDLHLMRQALAQGKKVIGIETEEFQIRCFASLDDKLQEKMLKLTLIDLGLIPKDAGDIMLAWNSGEEERMNKLLTKDVIDHPELAPVQEKILYERNVTMTESLKMYLKGTNTYLAALGTGHLVGPRSIIEHLKKEGFKVEQAVVGTEI